MSLMDMADGVRRNSDVSSESDKAKTLKTADDGVSSPSSPVINTGPVDAALGRHIIEGIEAQLPEFIEFSLLGKNRNYLRVNSLRQLQGEIKHSIDSLVGNKGALPALILENIASLKNSKDENSVFNYFGTFIEEYIHFHQRHYDGNASGQKILFDINRQQQDIASRTDKNKQQTELLASRVSGYLAQTFALLHRAQESDLSPWHETENLARNALIAQLLPTAFHTLNLREQMTADSLSGESLAGRKLNSLIHAATWKERRLRQQGLPTTAGVSGRAEIDGPDVFTGLGALLDDEPAGPTGGTNTAAIAGELPLLLQGIALTRKAAIKLQQKEAGASLSGHDLEFLAYIAGSCEKLTNLITVLRATVENVLPAGDALNDAPEKTYAEMIQDALTSTGQAIATHAPYILRPLEKMAWRTERVLKAQFTEKTDRLREAIGTHPLTAEEKSAVLQAGGMVKDLLQQAMANIQRINLAAQPLATARQYQTALEALLAEGETPLLDGALRQQQGFWQATVAEEKTALEALVKQTAVLSRRGGAEDLQRLIDEVLNTEAQSPRSAAALKAFSAGLSGHLTYLVSLEKKIAALPALMADTAQKNLSLSALFTPWLRQLEEVRSLLNAQISGLAGREPASFSRSGMLTRGIAVWHQERKAQWLQSQPAAEQEASGKQYDAAFLTLIKNYLPLLAKQHDEQGSVMLQRIKTEMVNAAAGTTVYPTTMAERLSTQKGMTKALQNSAIRSLVRVGFSAMFGSVSLVPSLATLPLRIIIRSLLTGVRLAYVSHKSAAAVKLGEGSAQLEVRQYRQHAVSQGVAKTAFGVVKPLRPAAGLVFLLHEIYQGKAADVAERVARELPFELGISSVTGTVRAVVRQHMAGQSAEEREQTLQALQRLEEDVSAADAEPIPTAAEAGEGVETALEAIANTPVGPAGLQQLAATLLKPYRAQRAAGEPPLRMERSASAARSQFSYDASGGVITLRADADAQDVLHEIAHALTARRLDEGLRNPDSEAGRICAELASLRASAAAAWRARGEVPPALAYYLGEREDAEEALHEFVAGVYSDSTFRGFLAGITTEGDSLWTRVTGWLCALLGITREAPSALFAAEQAGEKLMGQALTESAGEGRVLLSLPSSMVNEEIQNLHAMRSALDRVQQQQQQQQQETAYRMQDWKNWHGSSMNPEDKNSLVAWLGSQGELQRELWFNKSELSPIDKQDLRILLAEQYFIYKDMVSGDKYVKWISDFKKWPTDFQRNNRIVGVLRDTRTDKSFPKGKGMLFTLKDSEGNMLFSKIYYPQEMVEEGNTSRAWQRDILSQIEVDMQEQPISVAHIDGYTSHNPTIAAGIGDNFRVFIAEESSRVSSVDIRFIDTDPPVQNKYNKISQAESAHLDNVLIEKSAAEGVNIQKEDLDKKYMVKFKSSFTVTYARMINTDSWSDDEEHRNNKEYTLREILLGTPLRDEESTVSLNKTLDKVIGVDGLTKSKIENIASETQLGMNDILKKLKSNEEFRSSNIADFQERTDGMLLNLFLNTSKKPDKSETDQQVLKMINDYNDGKLNLSLVDLNMPRNHTLGPLAGLSTYPVPGMLALRGPKVTILISLTNNDYYIFPTEKSLSPDQANLISSHLSLYNQGDIKSTFKTEWELAFSDIGNSNTDATDNIFEPLFDRYMDSIASNVDYAIFTAEEKSTQIWTEKGQTALRVLAAVATIAALTASGKPHAAIAVGMLIEAADIAVTAVKMDNADRPDTYRAAKNELIVQSILFAVFNVSSARDLLKVARTKLQQYLAAERKARAEVAKNSTASLPSRNADPTSSSSGYSSGSHSPLRSESSVNTRAASAGDNITATRRPELPHREPTIPIASRADLSEAETAVAKSTEALLPSELGSKYHTYLLDPGGNCSNAAQDIAPMLRRNGYTDVKIHELGIWPNGGIGTTPTNHYVVMATKDGVDIVVDLTAGQFGRYGFTGPIITTKNNWLARWQQSMKEKPRLLVKMAPLEGGVSTSPFAADLNETFNPQTYVPNATLLQSPEWYKSGGASSVSRTTINSSTGGSLSGSSAGSGLGSHSPDTVARNLDDIPASSSGNLTRYSTPIGSSIRTVHQATLPERESASNPMQQSTHASPVPLAATVTPDSTENAQRLVVHRGVGENSPHKTARNGWRPLTSIDQSDFDLRPGECIEYSFSYVLDGQKTTSSGRVRIPADQRINRRWHTYFSQQLNHVIYEDDDLFGMFNVQYRNFGERSSNLSYLDNNTHYNAVYASENSAATEQEFTWRILTESAEQSEVSVGGWNSERMAVHTGLQRESEIPVSFEGWQALTSLNLSDYDLPVGTKIQYAFSYEVVRNGKIRTVVKQGSVTLRTGKNRDWHREFGTELDKIIESDSDLRGIFDVDTLESNWLGTYNWGGVKASHYNNMYITDDGRGARNMQFSWRIEPKAGQLT